MEAALRTACRHNNYALVRELLVDGADTFGTDEDSETPLTIAVRHVFHDIVALLLATGDYDHDGRHPELRTALLEAVVSGSIRMVNQLLHSGIHFDYNKTAMLVSAAAHGYNDIVRRLLQDGANPNEVLLLSSALMQAAQKGHVDVVRSLLLVDGIDLDVMTSNGHTALMCAATAREMEIVEMLLGAGANPQPETNRHSALIEASREGHIEIMEMLLREGIDTQYTPRLGWPALHHASSRGQSGAVEVLLSMGNADVNQIIEEGDSALIVAAQEGFVDVLNVLLASGADINHAARSNNRTALMTVVARGHKQFASVLLAAGADTSSTDRVGNSILHLAVERNQPEMLELLVQESLIDVNHANHVGRTALMVACQAGHIGMVEKLLLLGADPSFVDAFGCSANSLALHGYGHNKVPLLTLLKKIAL